MAFIGFSYLNTVGVCLLACCSCFTPLFSDSDPLSPSEVMTIKEAEAIGVDKLTQQQQQAFSKWLEKWTSTVIQEAPTYRRAQSIAQWVESWPANLKPNAKKKEKITASKTENLRIYRNENGKKIELKDGSIWEIVVFDRYDARLWSKDDIVEIERNERDLSRPYTLCNRTKNQNAGAKLIQPAAKEYERNKEPPQYFEGAQSYISLDSNKAKLRLSDGTVWKISLMDLSIVEKTWEIDDRIRVEKSNDSLYRNKLINLDNGSSVKAMKLEE